MFTTTGEENGSGAESNSENKGSLRSRPDDATIGTTGRRQERPRKERPSFIEEASVPGENLATGKKADDEPFEEEFVLDWERKKQKSEKKKLQRGRMTSSRSSSGFVPPTHVEGPPSKGKAERRKRLHDQGKDDPEETHFVPPTRVLGPPSDKKESRRRRSMEEDRPISTTTSEHAPPTQDPSPPLQGELNRRQRFMEGRHITPSASEYKPPTRVSGPPTGTKDSRRRKSAEGHVTADATSEFVPPTRVSSPPSEGKGARRKRIIVGGGSLPETSEYKPPTQVSGPPTGSKESRRKRSMEAHPSVDAISEFVPPTRVSSLPPEGKGAHRKSSLEAGHETSEYIPPTQVATNAPAGKEARWNRSVEAGRAVAATSGYVPPSQIPSPPSESKGERRKRIIEDEGTVTKAGAYVHPTYVTRAGSRSDNAIEAKNRNFLGGRFRITSRGREAASASASIEADGEPTARSADQILMGFASTQPANIDMDEASVQQGGGQSNLTSTEPIENRAPSLFQSAQLLLSSRRSSRFSSRKHSTGSRRTSSTSVLPMNRSVNYVIDGHGHTMSHEEMQEVWTRKGMCRECGLVKTHKKEKYGPFGMFRYMAPQSIEGSCYKGYCLRCYDVQDLRRLLNDPNIPLDLPRHNTSEESLRMMLSLHEDMLGESEKKSPAAAICSSIKFQICMGLTLLGIISLIVYLAITFSKGPEPWISSPPTSAPSATPTMYKWNMVADIRRDNVTSFGYRLDMSGDGQTIAVVSPKYDDSRGRLDIFREGDNSTHWIQIGGAIEGEQVGDELGFDVSLSGDGTTVAVVSPGRNQGLLQVFTIDSEVGLVQKGQSLVGNETLVQYGYSVTLNSLGDRVFVGIPEYAEASGMVKAFDFDGGKWVQTGPDMIGPKPGWRFGHSISTDSEGKRLAVGAPQNDELWRDGGKIFMFELSGGDWIELIPEAIIEPNEPRVQVHPEGAEEGSQVGSRIRLTHNGDKIVSRERDAYIEEFPNAGIVTVWGIDRWESYKASILGVPHSGPYENAMLGYDMGASDSSEGLYFSASGRNLDGQAGLVRIFRVLGNDDADFGGDIVGPKLGENGWYGNGPSTAISALRRRTIVGYENVLVDDGSSAGRICIYDYESVIL